MPFIFPPAAGNPSPPTPMLHRLYPVILLSPIQNCPSSLYFFLTNQNFLPSLLFLCIFRLLIRAPRKDLVELLEIKMLHNLNLSIETEDSLSILLEIASENDVERFKRFVERDPSAIDEVVLWYLRRSGGSKNKMAYEERTPLMVAAMYGSLDVLDLILSLSSCDVNRSVGDGSVTALHCAASGGSEKAVEAVIRLLSAGADVNLMDAEGRKPVDVLILPPNKASMKMVLEEILSGGSISVCPSTYLSSGSSSPPLSSSSSPDDDVDGGGGSSFSSDSPTRKKEYPIDPSIPDIKNSVYASDEFRMFSFKVRPCSRAYSHDWTECPFVHPGENARRRDPRKYHYSCVPCPDFRKGACRRGDLCEYAHGVFECWLHPAQYRTRLCKDGIGCARRVCFFAHTDDELRPLFVSTGSAVPSPRSMEMLNPFTPPMSPSGMPSSSPWPPQSVPTLHLPANNGFQSSRLRASLSARDMNVDDVSSMSDFGAQHLNGLCFSPNQARLASLVGNRSFQARSKAALNPSNLDELFNAEISSPLRYASDQGGIFSPSHKSGLLSQFNTMNNVESSQISGHNGLLHASSPSRMSPRSIEQHYPWSSRLSPFAQQEKLQQLRSLGSHELGPNVPFNVGSPKNSSLSNWGSPDGKLDWGVNGEELGMFNHVPSKAAVEPDVSWVQLLVSPPELRGKPAVSTTTTTAASCVDDDEEQRNPNGQMEEHAVLGAWLENMQLDPLVIT